MKARLAFWIALAIPACAAQQPNSTQPRIIEAPLLDCGGLPCLEMSTASGKTLRLLIDTAEVNSYLDIKAAQSLGANLQALQGDSVSQVQQTVVPGAKIGDLAMGDFPFMVLDTAPQPNQPGDKLPPFPADGALTYKAFQNRLLRIDYAHHIVRLSEPLDAAQTCPQTCSDLVVKRIGSYGPATLTTTGFSVNGQPVEVQLDTLFTGTMLIYPTSVEKLGLKKLAKGKHKEFFPFTQGGVKLAQAEGATESFQDMQLGQDLPLYFFTAEDHPNAVSFDATVGAGLLSRAVAVFDFKGMRFWLEAAGVAPTGATPSRPPQR
jgi:hypothetical protein